MNKIKKKLEDLELQGKFLEAAELLKTELKKNPKDLVIQTEIGNMLAQAGDYEEALGFFRRVHYVFKDNQDLKNTITFCLNELGNRYHQNRQFEQATLYFEELISIDNSNWHYVYNYANTLQDANKINKAISNYLAASRMGGGNDPALFNNLGNAYQKINLLEESQAAFKKSNSLRFNNNTFLQLVHLNQRLSFWDDYEEHLKKLRTILKRGDFNFSPFPILSLPTISNQDYLNIADCWNAMHPKTLIDAKDLEYKNEKIHVGYMSSDFRNHPLYHLIFECLKHHNRDKFKIILLYNGLPEETPEHNNFKEIADHFINTYQMSDIELVRSIHSHKLDILVDLSGFTKNSRSQILKYRPTKIQVNWLGYPGTLGFYEKKPMCDYIFADKLIIPEENKQYFAEEVIYLEPTYQPNNHKRAKTQTNKENYLIPENKFVWGCFNQNLKITKTMFDVWLRILKACPDSILWLLQSNDLAKNNIKEYALKQNIDSDRILFADYRPNDEHNERISFVDVFLDCYPYNAHTSAADAIFQNIPIITLIGESFQSRVAASILKAVEVDEELVANNYDEYLQKSINIYENREVIKNLKNKIEKNKSKLFDTKKYTRYIENIYGQLIKNRHCN